MCEGAFYRKTYFGVRSILSSQLYHIFPPIESAFLHGTNISFSRRNNWKSPKRAEQEYIQVYIMQKCCVVIRQLPGDCKRAWYYKYLNLNCKMILVEPVDYK